MALILILYQMSKATQNATHAVATIQAPILIEGWTVLNPSGGDDLIIDPMPLSVFHVNLRSLAGTATVHRIVINQRSYLYSDIATLLHYCYAEGRMREEELAEKLNELSFSAGPVPAVGEPVHRQVYTVAKVNSIDLTVIEENGLKLVPVKTICDILGVASNQQIEKIKNHPILNSVGTLNVSTGSDGKQYEMFCLPLKFVFGWLFTIHPDRVAADAREAVIRYHLECYNALYDHFSAYYEYVQYRNRLVEDKLEYMEQVREEFRSAKDRLDSAKEELRSARSITWEVYREMKSQMLIPFESNEKGGN